MIASKMFISIILNIFFSTSFYASTLYWQNVLIIIKFQNKTHDVFISLRIRLYWNSKNNFVFKRLLMAWWNRGMSKGLWGVDWLHSQV